MEVQKEIRLFEAFAGVGAQYKALKNIAHKKNWIIKSVGIIEWYIDAIIAYQAIHYKNINIKKQTYKYDLNNLSISSDSKNELTFHKMKNKLFNSFYGYWLNQSKLIANNLFNITKVDHNNIPDNIDIFTYSFPCQDISNQGKQKGFLKYSKTRSGLLWEIDRLLFNIKFKSNKNLPKYLLLENVKAIVNKNHIDTLNLWLDRLEEYGYDSKIYILNSANFGSCQNRERVFILSVLKEHKEKTNFVFPDFSSATHQKVALKTILSRENNC